MWKVDQAQIKGTTTVSYADALNWNCGELREKSIHLWNTHASYGLKYKLLATYSEAHTATQEDELVAETTLAAGADASFQYNNIYYELILQVKTASGTNHATYEINRIGQGA